MGIKDLPKPGISFRATAGAGNFQRKLSGATRYGELKNLRDNQRAIVDAVKKYQGAIRTKGGLTRLQQRDAWLKIKKSDKTITKGDRLEIKQVLKHLGRGAAVKAGKAPVDRKMVKAGDGKSNLTDEQIRRNLARTRQLDTPKEEIRRVSFGGGSASTRVMTDLKSVNAGGGAQKDIRAGSRIGINNSGPAGFIGGQPDQDKKDKLPDNPLPKIPPGGIKPIGLIKNDK